MKRMNMILWMIVVLTLAAPAWSAGLPAGGRTGWGQPPRRSSPAWALENAHAVQGQACGSWSIQQPITTTYPVYATQCGYAAEPFHITDVRTDDGFKVYSNKEDFETRTATIYRPQQDGAWLSGRPVVVFVHGGAWVDGYADWYSYVPASFTGEMGWVTVVVDYRLTSDQVFLSGADCLSRASCTQDPAHKAAWYPDNIQDVATAVHWVYSHIGDYGGDASQVFVFGHSAGGHLVSLALTHPDTAYLRPEVQGLISMSGIYDLTSPETQAVVPSPMGQTFMDWPFAQAQVQDASPLLHLDGAAGLPPVLLLYAESDLPTLAGQTADFSTALQSHGFAQETVLLPGYDHTSEMAAIGDADALPTRSIIQFVEQNRSHTLYLPVISH